MAEPCYIGRSIPSQDGEASARIRTGTPPFQPRSTVTKHYRASGDQVRPKNDIGIPGRMRAFKGDIGSVAAASGWDG